MDRNLQARSSNRVYQAAGDQYILDRPGTAPVAVSNTLPRDTAGFTGRDDELRSLLETVGAPEGGTLIPVHAIDGMPGIGKTALAVHAGHLLAPRFPGGQFFVDLHAHSAGQGPVRPADALFALLSADGVDPGQIPSDLDARAALWRGRMAGRRALVILDNAAGREQVEALLPGAAGCLVLVTSRRRLTGLSACHAAMALPLGTLSPEHAAALFTTMAGRPVDGGEAAAIDDLVRLCGCLPLAICLLAAKLRPEPQWRVADLVRELAHASDRLTQMRAEDVAVAAAFDLSYQLLPAGMRRFFRRLGLHPGADLDRYAAAALDATSTAKAQRQLDALYHHHLLDQPVRGRYRMHDLIGEYARDRVHNDPIPDQTEAVNRVLDYYRYAAHAANRRLSRPGRRPADIAVPPSTALPELRTRAQALQWRDAERGNLLACTRLLSIDAGNRRVITFAAAVAPYLRQNGPWDDAIHLYETAATAAREAGDRPAQADILHQLGTIHRACGNYGPAADALWQALDLHQQLDLVGGTADVLTERAGLRRHTGDHADAAADLETALGLYEDLGDLHGQASALGELAVVRHLADDRTAALAAQQRALSLYRKLGDLHGEADTLNHLGLAQQVVSDYPAAIDAHRQALESYRALGDRYGEARALNCLGIALCEIGEHSTAEPVLTEALPIHRSLGYRLGQANALNYLNTVHRARNDHAAAERALSQALSLYRELGYQVGQADAINQLGVLARLAGRHQAAAAAHHKALAIARRIDHPLVEAQAHNQLGQSLLARDQPSRALEHHRRALGLAWRAGNPREEAQSYEGMGRCAMRLGDRGQAEQTLREAGQIYQRIGAPRLARNVAEWAERNVGVA
ncbi:ATP-binding protein [Plantactinospora sp. CA-290183]|uniref:ATP-binding protein n=1 Tax=Plantactinospora sp. CA-290183 TaxID=3240006 RepID=UPI003D94D907